MFRSFMASRRELTKWCMYGLVLLAPGSFVVLPALWFVRLFRYSRRVPMVKINAALRGDA